MLALANGHAGICRPNFVSSMLVRIIKMGAGLRIRAEGNDVQAIISGMIVSFVESSNMPKYEGNLLSGTEPEHHVHIRPALGMTELDGGIVYHQEGQDCRCV